MSEFSKIHLIGNAHLDPIWLWRWQEGCGEVLQTFRSALDRLNEYNDFVFTCSSAAYYKWVEDIDPDMFEEIKACVKQGRWVPVNGWWVQPDCNIPSGESFARQALCSQLYYYEKFGKICTTGYNVDSFGHNGMLPQLLRLGGMINYVMMRPDKNENPDAPQNAFLWESPDGSKVLTYRIPSGYGESGKRSIDNAIGICKAAVEDTSHGMMLFYGVGNHGGGPTRGDIEYMQSLKKIEGFRELTFSDPDTFFKTLCLEMPDLPVWKNDLQHHASGCYSATSLMKQLNRSAENMLYTSEAFSAVAALTAGMKHKNAEFTEAWRNVCFNQFHDVLCGCSIMEAYEDVRSSQGRAMDIASKNTNEALLRLTKDIDTWVDGVSDPVCEVRNQSCGEFARPVVIFNPLSFPVKTPVRTYGASQSVCDSDGKPVLFQNVRSSRSNDSHADTEILAQLPAFGYNTYWLKYRRDESCEIASEKSDITADESSLTVENSCLRVAFSADTGFISSLVDKKSGYDYAQNGAALAVPTVIDDEKSDTWAHNVFTFHKIKGVMKLQSIALIENGPVRAVIRVRHTFGGSYLSQDFILSAGQPVLRVKCKSLWQEKFTMLKMSFPVSGENTENTYEIPSGFIKRPANGEEEPAQRWGAISFNANGIRRSLSIINNSKYSYDCPENDMRITLIRNVIFADHFSHRPPADFNFTDEGMQRFEYGVYCCEGEPEKSDLVNEAAAFNIRPVPVPVSYHKGSTPQKKSFIDISEPNVIMTAFKFCEDGSGDVVIRLYETSGEDTRAYIMCDMLDAGFMADFGHNEIKSFRINSEGTAEEVNFLEGIVK